MNIFGTKKLPRPFEWKHWNPGLDNGHLTLGEVYKTLPTHEFNSYPIIVRALENPKSPIALHGSCTLLQHDLIHVLLGRGLFVQDEAFVIGYTMGTSQGIGGFEKEFFKFCAHHFYPKQYKFKKDDLVVYEMGFIAGKRNPNELYKIELHRHLNKTLDELRTTFNIDVPLLRKLYSVERHMIPTKASQRMFAAFEPSPT